MSAPTQYQQWVDAKSRKRALSAQIREFRNTARPHTARLLAFADGSTGYGRYKRTRASYGRSFARARPRRVYGRGGFWGDLWGGVKKVAAAIPRGTFQKVGGSLFGAQGAAAGSALSKMSGYGGYNRRLIRGYGAYDDGDGNERERQQSDMLTQDVPIISNPSGDDGGVLIQHREYIKDIVSPGSAFTMQAVCPVNPGMPNTFPWLSGISSNFSQWQIQGMMFEFVSTSGALSTSQALGEIIMAVNYNPTDLAFTNKQQMLNEVFAVSKVPSENAICPIECDKSQTPLDHLYVRNGPLASTQDPRFYDIGNFYYACRAGRIGALVLHRSCEVPESFHGKYVSCYILQHVLIAKSERMVCKGISARHYATARKISPAKTTILRL